MNKVYCNKETNIVEQILTVKTIDELPDDYFSTCYAVIDEEEKVNAYNLRYNKETNKFEIVEGLKAKDETIVEETLSKEDYNKLKEENEDLKSRVEKLEDIINQAVSKREVI